jgi:hypothetical protein
LTKKSIIYVVMEVDRDAGVIRFNPWEQNLTGANRLPAEIPLSEASHWLGVLCTENERAEIAADECIDRVAKCMTIPQAKDVFLHATQVDVLASGLERAIAATAAQ